MIVTNVDARLVELSENLDRYELTVLERAEHLAEQKTLYDASNNVFGHGGDRTKGDKEKDKDARDPRYTTAASKATGSSERTIRRDVKLAAALDPAAANLIRKKPIANNRVELQRMARLPAERQRHVAEKIAQGKAANVRAAENQIDDEMPPEPGEAPAGIDLRLCTVEALMSSLEPGSIGLVHADPPWEYDNQRLNGTTEKHYNNDGQGLSKSGMAEIAARLEEAYQLAADDTYLLLWCTMPMLKDWFAAVEACPIGWRYISAGAWHKTGQSGEVGTGKIGIGYHWRGNSEALLLYVKGKPKPIQTVRNSYASKAGPHSEKPGGWLHLLVNAFAKPRSSVLDLYAGRAPLAKVCLGRHQYYGAETSPRRHGEALEMLEQLRLEGQSAVSE